jgi:glycosyltransferase involved in cell wall biosynthesis
MYPSKKDVYYGVFVKNFVERLSSDTRFKVSKVVLAGKANSKIYKTWKYLNFYIKILVKMVLGNFDLIYVHQITHATPAIWISQLIKINKLCFNIHGDDLLTQSKLSEKLLNMAESLLIGAEMIVVPSVYFRNVLISQISSIDTDKIFVSPSCGVDLDKFNGDRKNKKKRKIFTVGYVSRIDKGKGWKTFLSAVNSLQNEQQAIQAIIAGGGDESNQLLEMIAQYGLSSCVEYKGGIAQTELPDIYAQIDVFVFPTERKQESLGLVGLEAMACGIPVIGSKIGGLNDYLVDGVNGFFFETGNCSELINCIKTYMNLPNMKRDQMKENALKTAKKYDANLIAKKMNDKIVALLRDQN